MPKNICRICLNNTGNTSHKLTERHFGFLDKFEYFKCSSCGCLQIAEYPSNISKYYPSEYNAYDSPKISNRSFITSFLKRKKTKHTLGEEKNILGLFLNRLIGKGFVDRLKEASVSIEDSILDVGTGSGQRLHWLYDKGFDNLHGTDIFIDADIHYPNGISVLKKDITEIESQYDFIMLNHVLEHMPNQEEVLSKLFNIVKPGKFILIRIPVFSNYMWDNYGDYWIGLEPPRHFYLHTVQSFKHLIDKSDFTYSHMIYESNDYQFIGSEQYKQGITRRAKNSYFENQKNSIFDQNDIKDFRIKAKQLDKNNDGFSACFYIKRPS